jgi:ATP-dependent RNA helicase DDX46/PRP5
MSEDERKTQRDSEQAVMDEEMRKRRERVKAWQEAKALKAAEEAAAGPAAAADPEAAATDGAMDLSGEQGQGQGAGGDAVWTLEDDEDESGDDAPAEGGVAPENGNGAAEGEMLDAPPPLAPLGEMPALPGEGEGDEGADDVVFSVGGSIQHRGGKRQHPTIGMSLGAGRAMPAPAAAPAKPADMVVAAVAPAVPLSLAQAQGGGSPAAPPGPVSRPAGVSGSAMPAPAMRSRFAKERAPAPAPAAAPAATASDAHAAMALDLSAAAAAAAAATAAEDDPDYDPLEAYMTGLYGGGDVAQQDTDVSFGKGKPGAVQGKGGKASASASIDDDSDDSDSDINPYGSNFITLDQIMGSSVLEKAGERAAAKKKTSSGSVSAKGLIQRGVSAGWESDSAMSTADGEEEAETGEEREAREEVERLEFITAIRRARELEEEEEERQAAEAAAEEEKKLAEHTAAEAAALADTDGARAGKKGQGQGQAGDLGRVFAGEGDVMEDFEIEAKKKSALELLEEQRRGKELKAVEHDKIQYMPFRKNLYIVPKALAKLDKEEVQLRRDALHINVRGRLCPCPVDTWEQCGLSDRVLDVIEKNEFKAPFAIQRQAIPAIMCGRDVIGVAKTGSGKTLAFLLPMIRHILDQPPLGDGEGPIGLIMAPARELAFQIYNEAKKFCKPLGLRATCVYGGAGIAEQIADLKRGAEVVVCTPGRMIDILCMQAGKLVSFRRVSMVVMDEADRMFDMGFEPQIKMITQNVRPDRQTVLFSATFPKQIEKLAKSILKLPLEIVVGTRSVANKDITQYVEIHDEDEKFLRLLQLLGIWNERGSVLVFVDKQDKCDQLFQDLLRAGYAALSLHGGKDQVDRDHTLHEFKTLMKTVMVATSVAGRGLDVPEIVCVINYNCPNHLEDYVHRIGRTGRAGRTGTAYTFISPSEEQYSPLMCKALEQAEQPLPAELQSMADQFKEKVSRGEAQWAGSGFMTKGFTFDASEMNETQRAASMQRRAYEIEQGIIAPTGDKDDETDDFYAEEESGLPSSDAADEAPEAAAAVTASPAAAPSAGAGAIVPMGSTPVAQPLLSSMTPLERAKAMAAGLGRPQAPIAQPAPPPLPPPASNPESALARAKKIAMSIGGAADEEEDYSKMHFQADLEINDYPPQVLLILIILLLILLLLSIMLSWNLCD